MLWSVLVNTLHISSVLSQLGDAVDAPCRFLSDAWESQRCADRFSLSHQWTKKFISCRRHCLALLCFSLGFEFHFRFGHPLQLWLKHCGRLGKLTFKGRLFWQYFVLVVFAGHYRAESELTAEDGPEITAFKIQFLIKAVVLAGVFLYYKHFNTGKHCSLVAGEAEAGAVFCRSLQ